MENKKKEYLIEIIPVYGIYETIKRQIRKKSSLSDNFGIVLGSYQGVITGALITNGLEKLLHFL